jgi:hypothetical protein
VHGSESNDRRPTEIKTAWIINVGAAAGWPVIS